MNVARRNLKVNHGNQIVPVMSEPCLCLVYLFCIFDGLLVVARLSVCLVEFFLFFTHLFIIDSRLKKIEVG